MANILEKIKIAVRNRTTYKAGLLLAKAYRILKVHTGSSLAPYGISTIEWAMLGLLFEHQNGLRSSHLALELGVEAPFITVLFSKLKKISLVDSRADAQDSRAKVIYITSKGKQFVPKVEKELSSEMRILIEGISKKDLVAYLSVLEGIIENNARQSTD